MAVTRNLTQLAADLRLGDGATAPDGPEAVLLGRIAQTATAMVLQHAPAAPNAIHDEAFTRLAGWLYDSDPSGGSPGGPAAMRASGAAALLAPYIERRGGRIQTGSATDAPAAAVAGLSRTDVLALVEDWAEEGSLSRLPADKVANALTLVEDWAHEGDNTLIPASKLTNAPQPRQHYHGAYSSLTQAERNELQIGDLVLYLNKFWIVADEAEARANAPLGASADGWRAVNDQFRGAAHASARQYDVGDLVIGATDELYFCTQAGSYTADQISASQHWERLTDRDGAHWLGEAASGSKAYATGDMVSISGEVYLCTQSGSYTSAQIASSGNWIHMTAEGTGGGGGGLDQAAVDARVAAGVEDWAEAGNTDLIPEAKLSNAPGSMLTFSDVDSRILDWAQEGNTDAIPAEKLTNAPGGGGGGSAPVEIIHRTNLGQGDVVFNGTESANIIANFANYSMLAFAFGDSTISRSFVLFPTVWLNGAGERQMSAYGDQSGGSQIRRYTLYKNPAGTQVTLSKSGFSFPSGTSLRVWGLP